MKNIILLIIILFSLKSHAQSAKEISYTQQGLVAISKGNFKLACENFEIAENFARSQNSPNYLSLVEQKKAACIQEERRLQKAKADSSNNSNIKLLDVTGSLSDIISNANFYLGKRISVRCASIYVGVSGQSVSCDSNGLSIWIDTKSLSNDQYKRILDNCRSRDCSLCAVGNFSKSSNSFILNKIIFYDEMFGNCFASRY